MHKIALLLFGVALAGCAPRTQAVMAPMIGKTDTQLLAMWGAPDRETTSGDGGRHLTWVLHSGDAYKTCQRNFTVIDHRVAAWTSNCPY
jgi:hypothetical protein